MPVARVAQSHYEILQVHPAAHPKVIRAAYRTLMGEVGYHPDRGGDHENALTLNLAYEVLRDSRRRRAYDETLGGHSEAEPRPPEPASRLLETVDRIRERLGDRFRPVVGPIASQFDLILEEATPFRNRVAFKVFPDLPPRLWPRFFALCRLALLDRQAWFPTCNVTVAVVERLPDLEAFLREARRASSPSPWAWADRAIVPLLSGRLLLSHLPVHSPLLQRLRAAALPASV